MDDQNELWRQSIEIEIKRLKVERMVILTASWKYENEEPSSEEVRRALISAIQIIDKDIMRLQGELVLDDLLSGAIDFDSSGNIIKRPLK